jgi:hypothetical protein
MMDMKIISEETNKGSNRIDFFLHLGNFLDEFYIASSEIKVKMLQKEPENMKHAEFVPYLAATSHKLANDYDLDPPSWAFQKRCYLPGNKPYFGGNAIGKLRLFLMFESPTEFKHRNLFVSKNAISRI